MRGNMFILAISSILSLKYVYSSSSHGKLFAFGVISLNTDSDTETPELFGVSVCVTNVERFTANVTVTLQMMVQEAYSIRRNSEVVTDSINYRGHKDFYYLRQYSGISPNGSIPTMKVASNRKLAVSVSIHRSPNIGGETFLALPYDAWGTSYVVAMYMSNSFIAITSMIKTQVLIDFRLQSIPSPIVKMDSSTDTRKTILNLNEFSTYRIYSQDTRRTLSGTLISADNPVGVVMGNTNITIWPSTLPGNLIEMAFPKTFSGRDFLISTSPSVNRGRPELVVVVSAEDGVTKVYNVTGFTSRCIKAVTLIGELPQRGGVLSFLAGGLPVSSRHQNCCESIPNQIVRISADQKVMVVHIRAWNDGSRYTSKTLESTMGMLLVVPISMYHNAYVVRLPPWYLGASYSVNFVVVISENKVIPSSEPNVIFKENYLHQSNPNIYAYVTEQQVNNLTMPIWLYSKICSHKFWTYLAGDGPQQSYIMSAGMKYPDLNKMGAQSFHCQKTENIPGDEIDNDCDGLIDEEYTNESDIDEDGQEGEDSCVMTNVNGAWSSWGTWFDCDMVSDDQCFKIRNRTCSNPPPGIIGNLCSVSGNLSMLDSNTAPLQGCNTSTCPVDCPKRTFSTSCKSCDKQCFVCEQFNGDCIECLPGYMSTGGFNCKGCKEGLYGFNCSKQCTDVCSGLMYDCHANNGTCIFNPEAFAKTLLAAFGVSILIIFSCCILCSFCAKKEKKRKRRRPKKSNAISSDAPELLDE